MSVLLLFYFSDIHAHKKGMFTGLLIPRYVSLKSSKVKVRIGPGIKYKTYYVYKCTHYPVKIIDEFDHWRKIQDIHNIEGWVHRSLVSGIRYVIVNDNKILVKKSLEKELDINQSLIFQNSNEKSYPILKVQYNVIAKLMKCQDHWCKVLVNGYSGWIRKINIWGVQ